MDQGLCSTTMIPKTLGHEKNEQNDIMCKKKKVKKKQNAADACGEL